MANSNLNLTGAHIFLKDAETGENIGNEVIHSHNTFKKTFTVIGKHLPHQLPQRFTALIVTDTSMDNCLCALKSVGNDLERILEFGIIKTDEKRNERGAPRFKISAPAIVRELNDFMGIKKTNNVFLVNLKDMSASGIMFSGPINQFDLNDEVLLDISKLRANTLLQVKVVRKQNRQGLTEEIACTITKMLSK